MPDPLLASKWIHLVDPFLALPCSALWKNRFAAATAVRAMIKMKSLPYPGPTNEMPSIKNIIRLKKKYDAPTLDELPDAYKENTDRERLYLWAANNFVQQIKVNPAL